MSVAAGLAFAAIAFSYYAAWLGTVVQWTVALVSLALAGIAIKSLGALQGWGPIYMIGSRHGLRFIDALAKRYARFWNEMAIWGFVLSFGILSYPLIKGRISKKQFVFGLLSLIFILLVILPYISVALPFINIPQIQSASSGQAQAGVNYLGIGIDSITFAGGFAGYVFAALLYNAGKIIYGMAEYAISYAAGAPKMQALTNQVPGVAPIIPGIDIPLFAGLISLAMLLIIHEFSHGFLSRMAKVRLKSIGLVLFGIIPMGAFVEPDETGISKLDSIKQTKVFTAGISANFIAMLVFGALTILFVYTVIPAIDSGTGVFVYGTTQGYPAAGVLQPGMRILYWNGYQIRNMSSFAVAAKNDTAGSMVTVTTNSSTYTFKAVAPTGMNTTAKGIIGVNVYEGSVIANTPYAQVMYFLYTVLALSFMLNFLVGAVNLLPLPGFDGWRIYKANISSKRLISLLSAIVVFGLLINVLPWLFYT